MGIKQLVGQLNENDIVCRRNGDRVIAFRNKGDAEEFAYRNDLAEPWPVYYKNEIGTMEREWDVNVGRVVECI